MPFSLDQIAPQHVAAFLIAGFLSIIGACVTFFPVARWARSRPFMAGFAVATIVVASLALGRFCYAFLPGKDVIIARAATADGIEFCVTHFSNYSAEPYSIGFYVKRPGERWGYFYIDHEDTRWFRGHLELDANTQTVSVKRGRRLVATYHWGSDTFTLTRWNRSITGPQDLRPESWSPEQAVKEASRRRQQ